MTAKIPAIYKIISDHIRSMVFLIDDGVLPANEGAGYVLRRIIRRAMRYLNQNNIKEAFLFKIAEKFINRNIKYYKSLEKSKNFTILTIKQEEEKFQSTLDNGLKILVQYLEENKNSKIFPGEVAFKLYDTYGFPLDLIADVIKDKNMTIDMQEFNKFMSKQKDMARKSNKNSFIFSEEIYSIIKKNNMETKFSGYEKLSDNSKIIAIIKNGVIIDNISENDYSQSDVIEFIVDKTPFYATSGGQNGDNGLLLHKENKAYITQTIQKEGLFLHKIAKISGKFSIGENTQAIVDKVSRSLKSRNHSATHLLHHCLKKILGKHIQQKGSNICSDYFSFDFNYDKALTAAEITAIENMVNDYICQNSEVKTEIMEFDEALKQNATALFGEKYDAKVRVLSMGLNDKNQYDSIELCGGTHVKNLGEIGLFTIISEKSIASGIRRIEAKSSKLALDYLKNKKNESEKLLIQKNDTIKQQEKQIVKLKQQILWQNISNFNKKDCEKYQLITHCFNNYDFNEIKQFAMNIKNNKEFKQKTIMVFFVENAQKANIIAIISKDLIKDFQANQIIKNINSKLNNSSGGGSAEIAFAGGIDYQDLKNIDIQSCIGA